MPMVNRFSMGHDEQHGWMMSVIVIAVLCALLFYGCFAWTTERVKPIKKQQNSLKSDLQDLLHNRPWWILLGAGVAALVFNSIRDGATVYYFKYYVVEEEYASIFFIWNFLCIERALFGCRASRQYCRSGVGSSIETIVSAKKKTYSVGRCSISVRYFSVIFTTGLIKSS